jgi:hypothetical protein
MKVYRSMKHLKEDWVTEGIIDFEYKKYILLAYLQYVREHFDNQMLYPFLSDLVMHYRNLQMIRDQKQSLQSGFPKVAEKADFRKLQISYKMILEDSELMQEIEAIVLYALDNIGDSLNRGKEIFDQIEEKIEIEPIGLTALDDQKGYFFLAQGDSRDCWMYRYEMTQFERGGTPFKGIAVEYIDRSERSITNTYENIKLHLVRKDGRWSNPATYLIRSRTAVHREATFLPMAKRLLLRHLNVA